jgi:hypothetical protein
VRNHFFFYVATRSRGKFQNDHFRASEGRSGQAVGLDKNFKKGVVIIIVI